jgi:hypothetical protein
MNREIRKHLLLHAIRWASNILVEVLANHGKSVSEAGADQLRKAIAALAIAEDIFITTKVDE